MERQPVCDAAGRVGQPRRGLPSSGGSTTTGRRPRRASGGEASRFRPPKRIGHHLGRIYLRRLGPVVCGLVIVGSRQHKRSRCRHDGRGQIGALLIQEPRYQGAAPLVLRAGEFALAFGFVGVGHLRTLVNVTSSMTCWCLSQQVCHVTATRWRCVSQSAGAHEK